MILIHVTESTSNNIINNIILKNGRISSIVLDLPEMGNISCEEAQFLLSGDWNMNVNNERLLAL